MKKSTEREGESSPAWDELEAFARQGVPRLLQRVLEGEVDSVLGRGSLPIGRSSVSHPATAPESLSVLTGAHGSSGPFLFCPTERC